MSKLSGKLVISVVVLVVIAGVVWKFWPQLNERFGNGASAKIVKTSDGQTILAESEYISFAGNFFFAVPSNGKVDEATLPGVILVHSQDVSSAKNLKDLYDRGSTAIQPLAGIKDKTGSSFKSYIKDKTAPGFKDGLDQDDIKAEVSTEFGTRSGRDTAEITATQDGKPIRYMFIFAGNQPVMVVAKDKDDTYKLAAQTINDGERFDGESDLENIKKAILEYSQLAKDKKAEELYGLGTKALQSESSADSIAKGLESSNQFLGRTIAVPGGNYTKDQFTAQLYFAGPKKEDPPVLGVIMIRKESGTWKLEGLSLPSPA